MKVDKYIREVEAVYFDGINNAQEIANWCGGMVVELVGSDGRIRSDMYAIDIPVPGGMMTAGVGWYIIKDGPSFFAMDGPGFESNFTKEQA